MTAGRRRSGPENGERQSFYRYGVVLLFLAAVFTFAMVAPAVAWARLATALLQGGAVLAALSRAGANRKLLAVALASVAVTVAAAGVAVIGTRAIVGIADLASAILLVLVPVAIVLEFRRNLAVTVQAVMAALCIYLVLGMFFASIASAVSAIGDHPYFAGHSTANSSEYTYFSFITLATVGYGDYVPVLSLGRALAVLEGLLGQLYLVTVVALVVSRLGPVRSRSGSG
jgi:hypothetical protein